MKNQIKSLVKEMIPVTLGILIALLLNNWKEQYDDKKFIDKVLSSVTKELNENKLSLDSSIIDHVKLRDTINFYLEDDDVPISQIISKVKGFGASSIKTASWKAFLNQKIELVDYEIISALSDIEEDKDHMKISITKIMDFLYENMHESGYQNKQLFQIAVNDFIFVENELLKGHNKYLQLVH